MGEQNQIPYLSLKLWAPDSCFWAQTRQSRTPTRILGETILDQFWFPPFPACWSSIHSRVTAKRTRRVQSQKVKEMSLSGWVSSSCTLAAHRLQMWRSQQQTTTARWWACPTSKRRPLWTPTTTTMSTPSAPSTPTASRECHLIWLTAAYVLHPGTSTMVVALMVCRLTVGWTFPFYNFPIFFISHKLDEDFFSFFGGAF